MNESKVEFTFEIYTTDEPSITVRFLALVTSNSDAAAATDGDDDNAFGADAAGDGLNGMGQCGR